MGLFPYMNHSVLTGTFGEHLLPHFEGVEATSENNRSMVNLTKPKVVTVDSFREDYYFLEDLKEICPLLKKVKSSNATRFERMMKEGLQILVESLGTVGVSSRLYFKDKNWNIDNIILFFEAVRTYQHITNQLPNGVSEELMTKMRLVYTLKLLIENEDYPDIDRLYTHAITSKILEDATSNLLDPLYSKKYSHFSAKEKTILSFLKDLNLTSTDCIYDELSKRGVKEPCHKYPPTASSLVFEFAKDENHTDYFRLFYNGEAVDLRELTGANSSVNVTYYPLQKVKPILLNSLILEDFSAVCGNSKLNQEKISILKRIDIVNLYVRLYLLIGNIAILILICFCCCCDSWMTKKHARSVLSELRGQKKISIPQPQENIMTTERYETEPEDGITNNLNQTAEEKQIKKALGLKTDEKHDSGMNASDLDFKQAIEGKKGFEVLKGLDKQDPKWNISGKLKTQNKS